MEIIKRGKNVIVEIPLKQPSYDAINEYIGDVPNVVGVIVNSEDDSGLFEQGIYQLNELGYKNDTQLGGPLIMTGMDNDEFRKLCSKLNIDIWEFNKCAKCQKTLWGTHTMDSEGKYVCMGCGKDE